MTSTQLGGKLDTGVATVAERIVRKMTRRDVVQRGVLGVGTVLAALTVGVRPSKAQTLSCSCGPTVRCDTYGWPCQTDGCPSGMYLCQNTQSNSCSCINHNYNVQGFCCLYGSGWWIACNGICCGNGGCNGYRLCYDCLGHGCDHWCTCLGSVQCCECATPEDARREQGRFEQARVRELAGVR
jgi:hypothetical protein